MKSLLLNLLLNFLVITSYSFLFIAPSYASNESYYQLPAEIDDFKNEPKKRAKLIQLWNVNMSAFNLQGIIGNPWTNTNDAPRINYLDPLKINTTSSHVIHPITWTAFPNRVNWYFHTSQGNPYQVDKDLLYPLADDGRLNPNDPALQSWIKIISKIRKIDLDKTFKKLIRKNKAITSSDLSNFAPLPVPNDICPLVNWNQPATEWKVGVNQNNFGPPGPRGWKDEYNEWVVTRNAEGKVTKVSFTAENPEYWFSMWKIDPNKVLSLYRQLVSNKVQMTELYLRDKTGKVVNDYRGKPAYNPLNKWNYGNRATENGGGAVHLTSPPNTVGAEIYLGAAATIVRTLDSQNYSPQQNNCYAQYGSSFRNSDPNIGFQANQVVKNLKLPITLTNPIALYMQTPNFSNYVTPDGTPAKNFFKIIRGRTAKEAGRKYDQILHAVFEVPKDKNYTVSDITIGGTPIWWGSQIAETFNQALAASAYTNIPLSKQNKMDKVVSRDNPNPWPQPLVKNAVLQAVLTSKTISAATIPLLPLAVTADSTLTNMALEVLDGAIGAKILYTRADGSVEPGIKIKVIKGYPLTKRQIPGKHHYYETYVYVLDIIISKDVKPGQYGVHVTNKNNKSQAAAAASLTVLAK